MTKKIHTLQRRLAARRAIALLTGSHACLGLANRMVGPVEVRPGVPYVEPSEEAVKIRPWPRGGEGEK